MLALRTEAQPLLGAALLARPLARPPETLTYHTLLERAARGDGAGPSVTWAQLADCDGKAGTCPNADAMASLKQQVPDNAAVWMLALGRDLAAAKDEDVRSDLTRAAQAKTYDDYLGSSLQALARTVSQLPPPPETYDPLSGAGSAGVQLTIVYGLGATQPLPAFPATARYCESHKDDEGIRNDCLGLGKVLEWGSSPLGRSLGLHLREVLSPDDAQQADARRARVNLVWQMQNFAQLNVRAQGEKPVAQKLLMLARNGGTEMSVVLAPSMPMASRPRRRRATPRHARRRGQSNHSEPHPRKAEGLVAQRLAHELRLGQRALVGFGVVVLRGEVLRDRAALAETAQIRALAGHGAAPPAGGVARLREGQGTHGAEAGGTHGRAHGLDQLDMGQRRFGLLHQDAAVAQRLVAGGVEGRVEQALRRADRVRRIDDDQVERFRLRLGHVLDAVDEQKLRARVVVAFAQFREIFLGQAGDALVDFHLHRRFHFLVLEHFAQGAAVAAADDHHALGAGVGEQRRVGHHFVVQEIVAAGEHHAAVDHHQVAPVGGLVDLDRLEGRFLCMKQTLDTKTDGGTGGLVGFGEPAELRHDAIPGQEGENDHCTGL